MAGLLKRCGCKTWCHQTHQCGCKGKGKACGEGCNCTNYTNTDCYTTAAATNGTENTSIEEVITDALPEDLDEIMSDTKQSARKAATHSYMYIICRHFTNMYTQSHTSQTSPLCLLPSLTHNLPQYTCTCMPSVFTTVSNTR